MYTKEQFNRLLKTRKRWTGKQIGRLLLQMDVEELNGEEPVTNVNVVQPLVDCLSSPEDNRDYTLYANLYSGIVDAWNYIDASGNDAIANLAFMKSIITSLTDYSNAEDFHRQQPVMITQADFEKYKEQYNKKRKEYMDDIENELQPFLELIDTNQVMDDGPFSEEKKTRSYGKNASKVIEAYQDKYFTDNEVSFIRNVMQSTVAEREHQDKEFVEKYKDEFWSSLDSTYKFLVSRYNDIQYNNQGIKNPSFHDDTVKKLKEDNKILIQDIRSKWELYPRYLHGFNTHNIVEALGKYISLIQQEQLEILYSKNISFNEALKLALKKYPYSFKLSKGDVPRSDKEERYPDIPYVPDKMNYADLLFANEKTTNIASEFFNYLYMAGKGNNKAKQKELDTFLKEHFSEFIEATKKDLIKKYPKMDKILNEVTNSTSYIIPYITTKSLATAGIEWAESYISDAERDVRFTDAFPKKDRHQAKRFGFAVVHSHYPSEPDEDDYRETLAGMPADLPIEQHYDIPDFVQQTLSYNGKALKHAVKSIRRFAVLQNAYEDYFKGIARIAGDKTFRNYDKTPAYYKLKKAIKSYEKSLYALISTLHMIIDDPDEELKLISAIKEHLPLVSLNPIKYKKKTIKDVASLLEESYLSSTPANTMSVLNAIAEGAEW